MEIKINDTEAKLREEVARLNEEAIAMKKCIADYDTQKMMDEVSYKTLQETYDGALRRWFYAENELAMTKAKLAEANDTIEGLNEEITENGELADAIARDEAAMIKPISEAPTDAPFLAWRDNNMYDAVVVGFDEGDQVYITKNGQWFKELNEETLRRNFTHCRRLE